MDQNGDNMILEIPFSYQELLYGDNWQLWDTFPTVDNSNSPGPTIEMNHNGLAVESDPLMALPRSSTNIEEFETASQQDNLEVFSQEDLFTYEIGYTKLLVGDIDISFRPRKYENCTDETQICVICLNKLEYGEGASKLKCRHEYHFECIKKWLMLKNVCPLCKQKVI